MLQEILGRDAIAGRAGIARELKILLQDLVGIAADPRFLSTAVICLVVLAAAAHAMGLARTTSASASVIVVLFHV